MFFLAPCGRPFPLARVPGGIHTERRRPPLPHVPSRVSRATMPSPTSGGEPRECYLFLRTFKRVRAYNDRFD
jgi:hypothetical protein